MISLPTLASCFALLLNSPGDGKESFIIHGYQSLEEVETAKREAIGSTDAIARIKQERYEASPQYAIDQENNRKAREAEQAKRLKLGCKKTSYELGQPLRCQRLISVMPMGSLVSFVPWNAKAISEPCVGNDNKKQEQ